MGTRVKEVIRGRTWLCLAFHMATERLSRAWHLKWSPQTIRKLSWMDHLLRRLTHAFRSYTNDYYPSGNEVFTASGMVSEASDKSWDPYVHVSSVTPVIQESA